MCAIIEDSKGVLRLKYLLQITTWTSDTSTGYLDTYHVYYFHIKKDSQSDILVVYLVHVVEEEYIQYPL